MITSAVVMLHLNDGRVIKMPCHRHADAFYIASQLIDKENINKTDTEQGFLDENGKFYTRFDAMAHAKRCNQIPKDETSKLLFSEDLW